MLGLNLLEFLELHDLEKYSFALYPYIYIYGVSKNRSFPPKWMVKITENPIKMDDFGGPPLFLETPIYKVGPCS